MASPKSNIFDFQKLLSSTDFCQSWLAVERKSGRRMFVKVPGGGEAVDTETVKNLFTASFIAQQPIRTSLIVTAAYKCTENGRLLIAYPFLDPARHQVLSDRLFGKHFPESLYQVCLIVDYLHIMNRVHCDLKFVNFHLADHESHPRFLLTDLDFLTIDGKSPRAKIMGSRDYIAPEILRNETITTKSDIYSIGAAIRQFLQWLDNEHDLPSGKMRLDELRSFSQWCMDVEPSHRPRSLLDALLTMGIADDSEITGLQKRLFGMVLISRFLDRRQFLNRQRLSLHQFIVDHLGLFGLPMSLVSDFEKAYHMNRRAAFTAMKQLVRRTEIKRQIKYWHVICVDEHIAACYDELGAIDDEFAIPNVITSGGTEESTRLLAVGEGLHKKGEILKAFLTLKRNLRACEAAVAGESHPDCLHLYRLLGTLASTLNRSNEAIAFKTRGLEFVRPAKPESLQILLDLVSLHISRNDITGAEPYIERGLREAGQLGDQRWELEFLRWQAWTCGARAGYDRALDILNSILLQTESMKIPELMVKVLNDSGVITWRRGNYPEAKKKYLASIELARRHHLTTAAIPATVNLAVLLFELAHYDEAIRHSKRAIAALDRSGGGHRITPLLLSVFHCYVRLGDYSRAEYWLHRYWANAVRQLDRRFFSFYNAYRGWLALNRFEFKEAEEYYYYAIELQGDRPPTKHLGNIYQSLAEMSLYRGHIKDCRAYASKARGLFSQLENEPSLAETMAIEELCAIYTEETPSEKHVQAILQSLLANNCCYYTALFLVHILLRYEDEDIKKLITAALGHDSFPIQSDAPIFKVLSILLNSDSEKGDADVDTLNQLKNIYRILDNSRHYFLNIFVCMKIADRYRYHSKDRLAKRFYRQADNLSRRLDNDEAGKIIHLRMETMNHKEPENNRRSDILFQISAIMKDIHNYEMALEKVIQFAVDETGAERGVLILCSKDSQEMRVKTSVNCDDSDISDVLAISRSIPRTVAESTEPMMIDDATQDKRTKDLASVLMHNIKSVLCLPIGPPSDLQGILYLDHHTIPALFDSSDMVFVSSMTNFLAIMLSALESVRVAQSSTTHLTSELASLGAGHTFIAADPVSTEILEKLPEIARTNASILITGESGTGKEVLCHNIVRLSLRADRPLVKLNCAAIPTSLIESELFGVAKGVATGVEKRSGRFIAADGGTLFLDEIADMPLEIQAKVLRVLEYQQFEPVGSNRTISTDIRFIYATNKDVRAMVQNGTFRKDLYYRINTITIDLPPLRDRPHDIMALSDHFLKLFSQPSGKAPKLSDDSRSALLTYAWPGNVRELRNLIEKLCIVSPGKTIHTRDLPQEITQGASASEMAEATALALEKNRIRNLLMAHDWNQSYVSRIMDLPLSTLRRKIKKFGIKK